MSSSLLASMVFFYMAAVASYFRLVFTDLPERSTYVKIMASTLIGAVTMTVLIRRGK